MEIMDEDANAARITSLRQRLASLHMEHALVENELASMQGSRGVVEGADYVPIEERVTCEHFCAHLTSPMDPALWHNLPEEVLEMVFARLPLLEIVSLQCLSKAWQWNVTVIESRFRWLCASLLKRTEFVLVNGAIHNMGVLSIKMFDVEAQKWHKSEMTVQPEFAGDTMAACDGGLVCFVSRMLDKVEHPLCIVVLNPLTKEYKVLPMDASLNKVQPQMVQLIMDCESKCYKVLLVGKKNRRSGIVLAKVYSSATGRWSNPYPILEQVVFGYHFHWRRDRNLRGRLVGDRVGPCAYASHEGEFLKLGDQVIPALDSSKAYALVNDRLFVLHYATVDDSCSLAFGPHMDWYRVVSRFVLLEYQGQRSSPYWVGVGVHNCTPLDRPGANYPLSESYRMILHVCPGSLMITVLNNEFAAFKLIRTFLYDLSTYKWQEIPAMPGSVDELNEPLINGAMCELQWNAVP